jgi:hypothetical protein
MVHPSTTFRECPPLAVWEAPALGLLLAGLGIALLSIGMGVVGAPPRPPDALLSRSVVRITVPTITASVDRFGAAETGVASKPSTGGAHVIRTTQSRPQGRDRCLGAELATGRRAESMHLATVPVQHPADCGNVRDAITAFPSLAHSARDIDVDAVAGVVAATALSEAEGLDRAAAALYGPPDRQPQATQEALLEETAAARLLVP